jgi:hypothetical protein
MAAGDSHRVMFLDSRRLNLRSGASSSSADTTTSSNCSANASAVEDGDVNNVQLYTTELIFFHFAESWMCANGGHSGDCFPVTSSNRLGYFSAS